MIDSAELLYGVPDEDPAELHRTVEANPALKWVHTTRAGGGAQVREAELPPDALERIVFTTAAGVHAESLADFSVLGVLAGLRGLGTLQDAQRRTEWIERWPVKTVESATVVVVGTGHIGCAAARKLRALGAHTIGVQRSPHAQPQFDETVGYERLHEVLARADSLVVALPGTALTHHLIDRHALAALAPHASVINVGRGSTIDEVALVDALHKGRLRSAALDVFEVEPLPATSPLWGMPHVIVSPHGAAITAHEDDLIVDLFIENANRLLDGQPMRNVVNITEFY
nr:MULTISPECIES: D-2-hydroxyacid dehydrogenase [Microbacterium]